MKNWFMERLGLAAVQLIITFIIIFAYTCVLGVATVHGLWIVAGLPLVAGYVLIIGGLFGFYQLSDKTNGWLHQVVDDRQPGVYYSFCRNRELPFKNGPIYRIFSFLGTNIGTVGDVLDFVADTVLRMRVFIGGVIVLNGLLIFLQVKFAFPFALIPLLVVLLLLLCFLIVSRIIEKRTREYQLFEEL